jgi:hypothetical protein
VDAVVVIPKMAVHRQVDAVVVLVEMQSILRAVASIHQIRPIAVEHKAVAVV